jgi:hypothetical protein
MLIAVTTEKVWIVARGEISDELYKSWMNDPKCLNVYLVNVVKCDGGAFLVGQEKYCDDCGKTGKTYEIQDDGFRYCPDCYGRHMREQEEELRNDPDNYCVKCGAYSEILERGKCPACFESGGYI